MSFPSPAISRIRYFSCPTFLHPEPSTYPLNARPRRRSADASVLGNGRCPTKAGPSATPAPLAISPATPIPQITRALNTMKHANLPVFLPLARSNLPSPSWTWKIPDPFHPGETLDWTLTQPGRHLEEGGSLFEAFHPSSPALKFKLCVIVYD